ncbi:hypothetical protein N9064_01375 [bacterium]|nr:hypothetical protein [bacterium]
MSRTLTTSMRDALVADTVRPIYLVRMVFDSSESPAELNLWSGVGDLSYGGETYLGVGDLLGISEIKESFLNLFCTAANTASVLSRPAIAILIGLIIFLANYFVVCNPFVQMTNGRLFRFSNTHVKAISQR